MICSKLLLVSPKFQLVSCDIEFFIVVVFGFCMEWNVCDKLVNLDRC